MIQLTEKQVECIDFINQECNKEIFIVGNCRSGKTFAIIANLVAAIANKSSRNLICISDVKMAKYLIKENIEPICKQFGISFKFNISNLSLEIGEKSKINFLFHQYKLNKTTYPSYDNIIIFGKHGLEFNEYIDLSRISRKIILEDNPFNKQNYREIGNNFTDWVYTYFIDGKIPYQNNSDINSNAVMFQLSNTIPI